MYIKDFDRWNEVKKEINAEKPSIKIRSGEIRWITFGVNVGSEIDGRGRAFTRPGLIIHVVGPYLALAVPMSTKIKAIPGYVEFRLHDKTVSLCLHQIRIISSKRILGRIAKISDSKISLIKNYITTFFSLG